MPQRERFSGTAEIDLALESSAERFWIHAARLEVSDVAIISPGAAEEPAAWIPGDQPGVVAIVPTTPLAQGEHTLRVSWSAPFDQQLKGLYTVRDAARHYAFTQMEPTSARFVFPCFDEPRFKTPFTTTLVVPDEHVAVANAPIVAESDAGDGLRRVRFARTPPLPTYLVALAVGPFDVVEADAPIPPNTVRDRPVRFRGITAMGKGGRIAGSLRETPALLEALERYFDAPYPYAKLDIVAVPDFASGAMENAGLITFREPLLLWDDTASEGQRRAFTYVMAHELAHQWFGNLVTMPWWDDIWLNEAFATWMGHRVVDEVRPEHGAGLSLLARVHDAMSRDSLASARSIRQPIDTSHDIRNAFDPITYSKGGGVLRMAEGWLGEEVFRDGLRRYMRDHRWGTATVDDLLSALGSAAGRDVAGPLRTFLFQSGVPTVEVDVGSGDAAGTLAVGAPARDLPLGSRADEDRAWQVPACVRAGAGVDEAVVCELVGPGAATVTLPEAFRPEWVLPNAGGAGYYRYRLGAEATEALFRRGWPHLDEAERSAAADALLAAHRAGALETPAVLRWLPLLARDESRHVATAPLGLLGSAIGHWVDAGDAGVATLRLYARSLYGPRFDRIGLRGSPAEDGETRLLRRSLAGFLALEARDPGVRREARDAARAWLLGPSRHAEGLRDPPGPYPEHLDADLRPIALGVAVQDGDARWFDALLAVFRRSSDAALRADILRALGRTEDAELGDRALALALDETLRGNEALVPVRGQLASPVRRAAAWRWLQQHFDAVVGRIATTRAGRLPWLAAGFCTEARATEVERFFRPRVDDLAGGPRNLSGATEAIRLCAAQRAAHLEALLRSIASSGPAPG